MKDLLDKTPRIDGDQHSVAMRFAGGEVWLDGDGNDRDSTPDDRAQWL